MKKLITFLFVIFMAYYSISGQGQDLPPAEENTGSILALSHHWIKGQKLVLNDWFPKPKYCTKVVKDAPATEANLLIIMEFNAARTTVRVEYLEKLPGNFDRIHIPRKQAQYLSQALSVYFGIEDLTVVPGTYLVTEPEGRYAEIAITLRNEGDNNDTKTVPLLADKKEP